MRIDPLIHSRLELLTLVSGLADSETVMVSRYGLIMLAMKDNGKIIGPMAKANSFM